MKFTKAVAGEHEGSQRLIPLVSADLETPAFAGKQARGMLPHPILLVPKLLLGERQPRSSCFVLLDECKQLAVPGISEPNPPALALTHGVVISLPDLLFDWWPAWHMI